MNRVPFGMQLARRCYRIATLGIDNRWGSFRTWARMELRHYGPQAMRGKLRQIVFGAAHG